MKQHSAEAQKIAADFIGKFPDSSNHPTWDEYRSLCASAIDELVNERVVSVLQEMENQVTVQIQQQRFAKKSTSHFDIV